MRHNSQELYFREPFGAVTCKTKITCRLQMLYGVLPESVILRLYQGNTRASDLEMKPGTRLDTFEVTFETPSQPVLLWYYFVVIVDGRVYYYGNNILREGGKGLIQEQVPPAYQITVYREDFEVPTWFKEAVMYQIFIDRFHRGQTGDRPIEPRIGSLLHGSWEDSPLYIRDPRTQDILRWTFFGGNLEGVMEKLPYLHELGVSVIYFNPLFEAPSNHRYDTGDYLKIDSLVGDNALFTELCRKALEYGIRIILDGVFSHTGSDSRYFNKMGYYPEVGAYQSKESPYYSWYRFLQWPQQYDSWWGINTLPNVNEMEPSYQEFIMGKEGVVPYWMGLGAKGWRLDVADELPDEFIKRLRRVMKAQDPEAILIGEVWEDASNKTSYGEQRQYLLGDELDSVMNYPFRKSTLDFMLGVIDAQGLRSKLMSLYENYPRSHFFGAMNLIGSHDVARVLTLLGEGTGHQCSEREKEKLRLSTPQRKLGLARLKLLVLLQMTFPGVPCMYYGDEAGLEGYADPFNRGPYPWGREDYELLSWYKKVIALRNHCQAIRAGDWLPLLTEGDVFGYVRYKGNLSCAIFLNRHACEAQTVGAEHLAIFKEGGYTLLEGEPSVWVNANQPLTLQPLQGIVLANSAQEQGFRVCISKIQATQGGARKGNGSTGRRTP